MGLNKVNSLFVCCCSCSGLFSVLSLQPQTKKLTRPISHIVLEYLIGAWAKKNLSQYRDRFFHACVFKKINIRDFELVYYFGSLRPCLLAGNTSCHSRPWFHFQCCRQRYRRKYTLFCHTCMERLESARLLVLR